MTLASLTDCEQLVMKTVWDAEEELSLMEIMQRVNDRYHKDWKPQHGIHVLSPAREERISEALPPGKSVLLPDPGTAGGVQRPADE